MLFRGNVDLAEARAKLHEARCDWLDLMDNGLIPGGRERFPSLDVEEVHAYHLVPRGVSKRSAVAIDRKSRGLDAAECIAVGDSPSDVDVAPEVGAMFLVSNGVAAIAGHPIEPNVFVTDRPRGLGFAEVAFAFAGGRLGEETGPPGVGG